MKPRLAPILFAMLLPMAVVQADEKKPTAAPAPIAAPTHEPGVMTFHLMDNSVITGRIEASDIAIDTAFGSLKVPVNDLVSFTPGLDSHADVAAHIKELIEKLGSINATERDQAQAALTNMGTPVRKQLMSYTNDPDPERQLRINAILEEIAQAAADDDNATTTHQPELSGLDQIETASFTVAGKIVPQTFLVDTPYGKLTLKISDIRRSVQPITAVGKQEVRKTVTVDGTNMAQMNPKDSGIHVNRGDQVIVQAEGNITMSPWGGNNLSTPEGMPQLGWYMPNQIAMGALIGQIGHGGEMMKIGNKCSFKATKSGTLFFSYGVNPQFANGNTFPGNYTLKVRVVPQ